MKKNLKYLLILILLVFLQGGKFVIDATKNAVMHNEKGVRLMADGYYAAAAMEFKLAIGLNPDSAASATFYNNLGLTYMHLHRYDWAATSFERAVNLNPNFLEYYRNLVIAYRAQNIITQKVDKHIQIVKKNKNNSNSWLLLGLMYVELKYDYDARLCLKEFKKLEPDLLLTQGVDDIINKLK
ncbi:MAG: tetratricopeptide TPR_1 repeat-containing protein [uncultured bacterium]|nr:MAG: tetratricopeptide TPR_1 repeat-containing protein [uncultured bacterium]HBH18825.1 hypothetical protein [Cyanobacteria bacterium UBA9579]